MLALNVIHFSMRSDIHVLSEASVNAVVRKSLKICIVLCKMHSCNNGIYILQDIPQQMNGSDCGVFSCKYAEYLSRDAPFTFSQVCKYR